jgi:hypothetical protein
VKTPILVAALSATALFGQTSGQALDGRVEIFGEFMRPRQVIFGVAGGTTEVRDQADPHYNGGGLRLSGELPGTQGWYYLLGGKLVSSSQLDFNGVVSGATSVDTTDLNIRYSYWVAGISRQFTLGGGMALTVSGEGRGEAITAVGDVYYGGVATPFSVSKGTTYFRPWLRTSLDWTVPMAGKSPYFGFSLALPLVKTNQSGAVAPTEFTSNTLKAMAPGFSVDIYAGLRF